MKRKIKVGVIGVGALGRHHARLHALNEKVEVVGVYDANPAVAGAVSAEFGFPAVDDMGELAEMCDALSVAVPSNLHHKVAVPLLEAGKHLLIEKPIATSVEDAKEMVAIAAENNLVLGVGHVERFNPVMVYLESRADKATFIDVERFAPYPPERPGAHPRGTEVSVILDLMIHDLDLLLHLVDSEVDRIDANGLPALSATEDIVNARILFKNGCVANVNASRIAPAASRKIHVFYTDSYLALDYAKRSGILYSKDKQAMRVNRERVPVEDQNALQKELENFIDCVETAMETGNPPPTKVSGEKGLAALRLAIDIENTVRAHNEKYKIHFE